MTGTQLSYRTEFRPVDYVFDFVVTGSSYRIYIVHQPGYRFRSTNPVKIHRIWCSTRNLYYICWDTPIRSFNEAQTIAASWAENTQRYVASIRSFPRVLHTNWAENSFAAQRRVMAERGGSR
jgi:hypothetical protein